MLFDLLVAVLIVCVAVALGVTVHPLFWLLVLVAFLWILTRRSAWRR